MGHFPAFVLLHFSSTDSDQIAEVENLQLALINQLADHAGAALPTLRKPLDRVWGTIVFRKGCHRGLPVS